MTPVYFGTGIFWSTLLCVAALLTLLTLVGRSWAGLFPFRLRGAASFYLAPALGLATWTVLASLIGRFLPLGNSVVVPILAIGLLVASLSQESSIASALRRCAAVSAFGLACGASVLGPLFVFGAFNAHNDGFTYLVHANWLQEHAFSDRLTAETVTPVTTQVGIYQQLGFRMGASFLLGFSQALLNLRWSYDIYPAMVIVAVAACCLAVGFPLAHALRGVVRPVRLALLALPAFTLGGLVFGANVGFLPQTVGLALGAGFLFAVGPLLGRVSASALREGVVRSAVPVALLFAGAVFAYSELSPFLVLAAFGSGVWMAFRSRGWARVALFAAAVAVVAALLLNSELIRVYSALRVQSGAVVGGPVDWSLLGFLAHALGVHGGAWDLFQWSSSGSSGSAQFIVGLGLTLLMVIVVVAGRCGAWASIKDGALIPAGIALLIFLTGLFYFRYFVVSPFETGVGQSWNQFKLSDWAGPFVAAFALAAVLRIYRAAGEKLRRLAVPVIVLIGAGATTAGVLRTEPLITYYGGARNLDAFYHEVRGAVAIRCEPSARVYLALNGPHHKFRQMASYYLSDRELASDWTDDGYIYPSLPPERRKQELNAGDCVVEPASASGWLRDGQAVGPFRIGVFDGRPRVQVVSIAPDYERESDGENWWQWVVRKATFQLQPQFVREGTSKARLTFTYATRSAQNLTVTARNENGSVRQFLLHAHAEGSSVFDETIEFDPNVPTDISFESDGEPSRLGPNDARMAAWMIRNVVVTPIFP